MSDLVIGDSHLRVGNLDSAKQLLAWIEALVEEHQPTRVINLGDTLHTHAVVRTEVMDLFTSHIFSLLAKWKGEYVLLVGNHDMVSNKVSTHPFRALKAAGKRLKVIDKPTELDGTLCLPYIHEPTQWQEAFDARTGSVTRVYCHQTFLGARMGQFYADDGVHVPEWDGKIISGHVHTAQSLGCVWYPGTPYAQDSNDADQVKGVNLIADDGAVTFIESPLPKWVTTEVTVKEAIATISGLRATDINRVNVTGTSGEIGALLNSPEFKELKTKIGFSVARRVQGASASAKRIEAKNVAYGVAEYIERVYEGAVDRAKLKKACQEVMDVG